MHSESRPSRALFLIVAFLFGALPAVRAWEGTTIVDDFTADNDLFDGTPLRWAAADATCCRGEVHAASSGICVSPAGGSQTALFWTTQTFSGDVAVRLHAVGGSPRGDASPWLHLGADGSGYVGGIDSSGALFFRRWDSGVGAPRHSQPFERFDPTKVDFVVELRTLGPYVELRAWALGGERPSCPDYRVEDETYRSGAVGFDSQNHCFTRVEITTRRKPLVFEDFDAYVVGQGVAGENGWTQDDEDDVDGQVVSDPACLDSRSLELVPGTDLIQSVDSVESGRWALSLQTYLPADFGGTMYLLLNGFDLNPLREPFSAWVVVAGSPDLPFPGTIGFQRPDATTGPQPEPLYDRWVELRLEVDLDEGSVRLLYDGEFVDGYSWPEGVPRRIEDFDLSYSRRSDTGTSPYVDSIRLERLDCPLRPFRRGDANTDSNVDISDAVSILGSLFLGEGLLPCLDAADANDDGNVDISDAVAVLSHLFLGGEALPFPGSTCCGVDPTADSLSCEDYDALS